MIKGLKASIEEEEEWLFTQKAKVNAAYQKLAREAGLQQEEKQ